MEDICRACGKKFYVMLDAEINILGFANYLNGECLVDENSQIAADKSVSPGNFSSDAGL